MRLRSTLICLAALATLVVAGCASESTETPSATADSASEQPPSVYFIAPADGDTLGQTVTFEMGADNVAVVPAGDQQPNSGHLHILINTPFVAAGEVIPSDDQHVHFGDGSTTAELTLPPGTHTLRLQLADWAHRGMEGDGYRDEITVTVQ